MICSLVKWMVSQSLDSGKALPPFAGKHAGRCRSCGLFLADAGSLDARLARVGAALGQVPRFVSEERVHGPSCWEYSMRLAVSAACILVIGGLLAGYSLNNAGNGSPVMSYISPHDGVAALLSMSGISMDAIGDNPESGLSREIVCLAQDARSAAQFLSGPLAFGIPEFN